MVTSQNKPEARMTGYGVIRRSATTNEAGYANTNPREFYASIGHIAMAASLRARELFRVH